MSLLFAQLIHANRERNSDMMEALFWKVLGHLQELSPSDGPAKRYHGLPRRFKRAIHAIDSTTIALVANCMDWAKHRRRKAPAKMHLRLNLQSFLPGFAVIEEASHHDDTRTLTYKLESTFHLNSTSPRGPKQKEPLATRSLSGLESAIAD